MARRDRKSGLKDLLQANRNMILYVVAVLAAVLTLMGWGLLPDQVSMAPDSENFLLQPKERLLAMHFGMTAVFSGLFWKCPREPVYLTGALFGLLLMVLLLSANLGV